MVGKELPQDQQPEWFSQLPGSVKAIITDSDTLAKYILSGTPEGWEIKVTSVGDQGVMVLKQATDD